MAAASPMPESGELTTTEELAEPVTFATDLLGNDLTDRHVWAAVETGSGAAFVPWREAAGVAGVFLLLSVLWIVGSDQLVVQLFPDPAHQHAAQTLKGLAFVGLTACLIFLLVYRLVRRLEQRRQALSLTVGALTGTLQAIDDLVFSVDASGCLTGLQGRLPRRLELIGRLAIGKRPGEVMPEHGPLLSRAIDDALEGRTTRFSMVWTTSNRPVYLQCTTVPLRLPDGRTVGALGTCRDVTRQHEAEEERMARELALLRASSIDPLTRLPNRRGLIAPLRAARHEPPRAGRPVGVLLLMDLDHFKLVNTAHGHAGGDRLLCQLADVLRDARDPSDTIARVGSDEFVAVLPGRDAEAGRAFFARVSEALLAAAAGTDTSTAVRDAQLSGGMVPLDAAGEPEQLLGLAEVALFTAKERGRGRCEYYPSLSESKSELGQAGRWLRTVEEALGNDGFALHLQPIFRLPHSEGVAPAYFEVLLRLPDGEGGFVSPGEFLPPAQRFGWMGRIDRWVIEHSLALLRREPDLELFVNLSAQGLTDDSLLEWLMAELEATPELAGRLTLEITESTAVSDLTGALAWMQALQERGCQFALDDFGAGFSTFDYLRRIPADRVKLDGSFIRNLESDPTLQSVVGAMVQVCHSLGKEVVAEMVETSAALAILESLGVQLGQGWLWSPALPVDEALALADVRR
ncbi:MAG: phosphodiesterase [Deltaproteobacteria bacterium]|nr:MAG: phosphodiesterase [Deltaproteobacteria bacterium]